MQEAEERKREEKEEAEIRARESRRGRGVLSESNEVKGVKVSGSRMRTAGGL